MSRRLARGLTLIMAAMSTAAAIGSGLGTQDERYRVRWGSMTLGEAHFRLAPIDGEPGCYRYETVTDPVGIVRLFYGRPHELSEFCVVDGQIRSRRMRYHNPKKKEDSFELRFDWQARQVTGPGDRVRELPEDAVDRLAMQQAVRLWLMSLPEEALSRAPDSPAPRPALELTMVDEDRMPHYRFEVIGREQLEIDGRRFAAVRVDRVDDPRKAVHFWVDTGNWRILRFEQRKGDDKPVSIEWIPPRQ